MADDQEPKSNVVPFGNSRVTFTDLGEPTDMTKLSFDELAARIEACEFESVAGPLTNCAEWIEIRRRLRLPPSFSPNTR